MTLCLSFPFALPNPVGSLLLADLKCSPVRRACDVRAAAMMAWWVSLPGCLFMAKLLMLPRRCRLVGRNEERTVFVSWFRLGDLPPRARAHCLIS